MATPAPKLELVRPLAGHAKTEYLVKSQQSIMVLPWHVRWILRAIHRRYHWFFSGHDGKDHTCVHDQAICTREPDAIRLSNRPGWSYKPLPVDADLPIEAVAYDGGQVFPASDVPIQVLTGVPRIETIERSLAIDVRIATARLSESLKVSTVL